MQLKDQKKFDKFIREKSYKEYFNCKYIVRTSIIDHLMLVNFLSNKILPGSVCN